LLSGIYFPSLKFDIFWSCIFESELFPFLSLPCPCLIHSRLFVLSSCLRFAPFFPFLSLGFRHFPPTPCPSGASVVLSCPIVSSVGPSVGIKLTPLLAFPTLTTDLPCLVLGPWGWLFRGKGGDQAPSLKSVVKHKNVDAYISKTLKIKKNFQTLQIILSSRFVATSFLLSLSLSMSLSLCFSLSLSFYVSFSFCLSLSLSLSFFFCFFVFLVLFVFVCILRFGWVGALRDRHAGSSFSMSLSLSLVLSRSSP
jgi:hypothetical protein